MWRRLFNAIWPNREDPGLERELASHLMLLEDEYRRRGMSADAARRVLAVSVPTLRAARIDPIATLRKD